MIVKRISRLWRPFVRGVAEGALGILVFLAQKSFDSHALWFPLAITTAIILLGSSAPGCPVERTSRFLGFTTALLLASAVHLYPVIPLLFLVIGMVDIPRIVIGRWSTTDARLHSGFSTENDALQRGSDSDNAAHQKMVRQWWLRGR